MHLTRRKFLKSSAVGVVAPFFISQAGFANESSDLRQGVRRFIHSTNDEQTTIIVPELAAPFTVMHMTDTHISCDNENDEEYLQYSKRMRDAYVSVNHYRTGQQFTPLESFENLLTTAKEKKIDLIFLTGDIINYPSETAVHAVLERLEATGIPFLYTAGNHDWHYEGMEGNADFLRESWVERRLKPLYRGDDPMCSATLFKGVNMVCIDDSTYRISERQLEFYREQKSRTEPLVLLMHIPIYMPTLSAGSCGHPEWGEAVDRGYLIERRERWPVEGCGKVTLDFVQEVFSTPNLVGIFTGHYHGSQTIVTDSGVQYITSAAAQGCSRIIRFE
jgi:predicted phosphodiesterase